MAAGGELLVLGGYGGREGSDFGGTGGDFVFFFSFRERGNYI